MANTNETQPTPQDDDRAWRGLLMKAGIVRPSNALCERRSELMPNVYTDVCVEMYVITQSCKCCGASNTSFSRAMLKQKRTHDGAEHSRPVTRADVERLGDMPRVMRPLAEDLEWCGACFVAGEPPA